MNLQEEITHVREQIAEPYRSDETNSYVLDVEILNWIRESELQVMRDVVDDALYTVQKEAAVTLTNGSGPLPTDFMRPIVALVQSRTGGSIVAADIISPKQARNCDTSPNWRPSPSRPYVYIFQGRIYVLPSNAATLTLRYVYRPTSRYKFFRGAQTTTASATVLQSSAMPSLATSYWVGSEASLVGGQIKGERSVCTVSTNASPPLITVSPAFSLSVALTTVWEIGQVCALPEELYPLWLTWAAHLAFSKDREESLAAQKKSSYEEMVQKINGRYAGLMRAEPAKEYPK